MPEPEPGEYGESPRSPEARARQLKFAGFGVLGILGLVFVVQNSESTKIQLIFWSVRMPLVFVLVAMIALGIGLDRAWLWRRRRR